MSSPSGQPETEKDWDLLPLTPEFIESEHRGYVKALVKALEEPKIRNVALSGRYGVGKSSILHELARTRKSRVVELSLSTLAPLADEGLDDAVPKQAKTTTNRIQQEIVKQLLYREKPSKTPGSRFRRIERFSICRELAFAGLAGTAIAIIALLTGWTNQIVTELMPQADPAPFSHAVVLVLGAFGAAVVRWGLYGRVQIRQLSAGAATVTLDDHSVSYFDQYLDEIVYFFEVSTYNIVIFEDIDRFNDPRIFETLLALNTLLNAQRGDAHPIQFIYAIKDSIFDQAKLNAEAEIAEIEDPAQAEAVRANRTKFFDLVIPVVPFITHRSAKNLVWKILDEVDSKVDVALTDLAARYIPDMRLIKNARNEFIVFRDRIFSGAGRSLELSETELFAMMLYKCTHLADFETISIGKSNIDKLYLAERALVSTQIARIQKELRKSRDKLADIGNISTESELLGNKLIKYVERTVSTTNYLRNSGIIWFNGKAIEKEQLRSSQFWQEFTQAPKDPVIEWKTDINQRAALTFHRSVLAEVLDNELDPDNWNERSAERLNAAVEGYKEDLMFLRQANMGDLIKRPDIKIAQGEEQVSFDAIARKLLAGDGLAYQLIRHGYINRNFTLYTATYHGTRVSAAAQNFIMHHVERDKMDAHFELEGPDVKAVVRECGRPSLAEPALYNIAILDYLLDTDITAADIMIGSLVQFGEHQQGFIEAYLNSASHRDSFIPRFTKVAPKILIHLVTITELAESDRLVFVSLALGSLAKDVQYRTNKAARTYLIDHYADFPILTTEPIDADLAERIANLFSSSRVYVSALAPLSSPIQCAFIAQDCYAISRENLEVALESASELTLDRAFQNHKRVYQYLLQNVPAYLAAIEGCSETIGSAPHFISIVEDVLTTDADQLSEVIAQASKACVVTNIEEVSREAWPHLARHRRFAPTFANVWGYFLMAETVDASLASLLEAAPAITDHESSAQEDKHTLAAAILAAQETLPSASSRARHVANLKLDPYLSIERIQAENGELFALLLSKNVIEDSAVTYAYLSGTDWPTRERFIEQSNNFKEYMTPELVASDLADLLQSARVSGSIKNMVINDASDYADKCDNRGLAELARFAIKHRHTLTPEVIENMAVNNVPSREVVHLLYPNLNTMPYDQLARILSFLGDNYAALTSPGRDQPKFPDTAEDRALLNRLVEHGAVVKKLIPSRVGLKVSKSYGSD